MPSSITPSAAGLLVLLFAHSSYAVDMKSTYEETVVTGTRTPKTTLDSPVKVDVVSGEVLRKVSQSTVGRALNFMPGVVVKRSAKSGYNVFLQGYSANRVLVLVNGQQLISPTGSEVDLDQISVADIERIEIMRGAGSTLYGSAAMGGVINIITSRDYSKALSVTTETSSYLGNEAEGNEYGYDTRVQGRGALGAAFGKFNLQAMDDPGFTYDPSTLNQEGSAMDKHIAQLEGGYQFPSMVVGYRGQWLKEERNRDLYSLPLPGRDPLRIYYLSKVEQTQHDLDIRENSDSQNPLWKINLRHAYHEETSGNSNSLRFADMSSTYLDGQKIWMGEGYEVVGGGSASRDELEQIKLDNADPEVPLETASSYEAFAQYNRIGETWDWLAGVRYQNDSDFNDHSAFRFSGMKKFVRPSGTWQLRAGAGQSYRVPDLKELYYRFDHSNMGYVVEGNESLKPETAVSANTSIGWMKIGDDYLSHTSIELNIHYSKAENLIESVLDPKASAERQIQVYQYQNFEKTEIYGLDLSAEWARAAWRTQLTYSYLDAYNTITDQRLPDRPRHQLKLNVSYDITDNVNFIIYAVHERDEAPSTARFIDVNQTSTVNFTVEHQVNRFFHWRFGVDNLFDEHGEQITDEDAPFDIRAINSRRVFAGIVINLI